MPNLILLLTGLYSSSPAPRKTLYDERGIQVGDRVLVVGQRTGTVRFCGTTKFAPGNYSTLCVCCRIVWNRLHVRTGTLRTLSSLPPKYFKCQVLSELSFTEHK